MNFLISRAFFLIFFIPLYDKGTILPLIFLLTISIYGIIVSHKSKQYFLLWIFSFILLISFLPIVSVRITNMLRGSEYIYIYSYFFVLFTMFFQIDNISQKTLKTTRILAICFALLQLSYYLYFEIKDSISSPKKQTIAYSQTSTDSFDPDKFLAEINAEKKDNTDSFDPDKWIAENIVNEKE